MMYGRNLNPSEGSVVDEIALHPSPYEHSRRKEVRSYCKLQDTCSECVEFDQDCWDDVEELDDLEGGELLDDQSWQQACAS